MLRPRNNPTFQHVDDTTNEELPRWRRALRDFSNRANNICFVVTYPFMVVLTVVGLFVVVAFCIFPTLLLAIMVVCIYYCLTEDPIPLSVLLRYLLSVDEDEHGHPDHYTMAQNRPVVQKKLIIRKVLEVRDKTDETEESEEPPRGHPFPITIVTEKKVLKYSAPLIFKDEESTANENGEISSPPVSHAFRPAPPVDEEMGIQLTPQQTSPQSPIIEGEEEKEECRDQNDDHSKAKREDSSVEDSKLELPSASNDDDDDEDEVYSTNSIHEHHKVKSLEKMEEKPENNGNSDGETDSSGKLPATASLSLQDLPVSIESNNNDGGENDDQDEEDPFAPADPPPITGEEEAEPVQKDVEEEEGRVVIHDDYFGINEQQDRGTTCDICLLEFEVGDLVAWSPNTECSHCFHKDCILDWLVRKHSCPSCRKDYLKGAKDDDTLVAPNRLRHRVPSNTNAANSTSSLSGITR